jgi:hypothetical protein
LIDAGDVTMPNSHRFSLVALATFALGLGFTLAALAQSGASPAVSGQMVEIDSASGGTYYEVLSAGLKCRRPSEFAFVKSVAAKVETGVLPRNLVDSTYFWARRHPPYPYIQFEFALKTRAKKMGISL